MKRRSAIRGIAVAGAGFFSRLLEGGIQAESRDFVIRSDVRLVLLDVMVKDHRGALVAGLTKDNFQIRENGVPQVITTFSSDDLPVTVGILVDESRSMTPKRSEVLAAAETFLKESNPEDEVFVLNFSDTVKRGLPPGILFSSNPQQLRTALHRGSPEGKTALYDAVLEGLQQLEQGRRQKKALLVISDGGDTASLRNRRDTLNRMEKSSATVYAIGLFTPGDPDRDPGLLKHLARISGGEAYFPESPSGMAAICRTIATDIRTRYTIGYIPKAGNGIALRRIGIHISAPGRSRLTARARTSYRYEDIGKQSELIR